MFHVIHALMSFLSSHSLIASVLLAANIAMFLRSAYDSDVSLLTRHVFPQADLPGAYDDHHPYPRPQEVRKVENLLRIAGTHQDA